MLLFGHFSQSTKVLIVELRRQFETRARKKGWETACTAKQNESVRNFTLAHRL